MIPERCLCQSVFKQNLLLLKLSAEKCLHTGENALHLSAFMPCWLLQAPTAMMQASHTSISLPLGPVDLFGNYSVLGPAIIRKINNALVALVQPGGSVSVLNSSSGPTMYMSCASLSHDEDTSAVVNLAGHHMELQGSFEMHDLQRAGIEHDGKVIVSPATLSEDSCILLAAGGSISHPVNVHPQHSP